MTTPTRWQRLRALLSNELRHLTTIHASDRPWQLPFAAALASGLPLLVGAWFGHLAYGLIASLGGMIFLYLPDTALPHRMLTVMSCAFAITASYALGVISHHFAPGMVVILALITTLVTMVSRFYALGQPGSLFFIMAAAIGAYSPSTTADLPLKVGLMFLGSLQACVIAFCYSLYSLRHRPPKPAPNLAEKRFEYVVVDSVFIGGFVGLATALAQLLHMENAYWVPISCLAVIPGVSLRAVWNKQLHRLLGTSLGLMLAFAILMLPLTPWTVCLVMISLNFIIETLIVRHYGFATMFITPITILLADAARLGLTPPEILIRARFADTVLGCLVGLAGGYCLHHPRWRATVSRHLRRWVRTLPGVPHKALPHDPAP
ncbi:FUSC family protein [Paludibacterium sp. B53371]|uniref:FUSC family protein n=1 Tax=Paludibacterium sp. B53371 TaxID=2806263 RepID=UPI001C056656|nr:FUSC family protein [Paludibacterium sp. B53371]